MSEDLKATPGPWVIAGKATINSPARGWVASVSQHNRAANAHLIAAAPCMAGYIRKRADAGDPEAIELWERVNARS
jgi:hypothetical protein